MHDTSENGAVQLSCPALFRAIIKTTVGPRSRRSFKGVAPYKLVLGSDFWLSLF